MLKKITLLFTLCSLASCVSLTTGTQENSFKIKYLDEYVIYNDSIFSDSKIGGLSGIEYHKEQDSYYMVCDDAKNPRFYKASISIENGKINNVVIDQLIKIQDHENQFVNTHVTDLEAIRIFDKSKFIFTSEGSIKHDYNPAIFTTDSLENYIDMFNLPSYFLVDSISKNNPRHNGVFEGLVHDVGNSGYWAAMELPLTLDGEEPTITNSGAPVRVTYFNTTTKQADLQFTYPLDKLAKDPKEKFGINGVTALLQLDMDQFLIIERGYAAGYGTQGNTIRIFLSNKKNATNTLGLDSLERELDIRIQF